MATTKNQKVSASKTDNVNAQETEKKDELTRSQMFQEKVNNLLSDYFDSVAKADSDNCFSESEEVKEAAKALETAKLNAYYANEMCRFDADHITAKIFGEWAKRQGCKFNNQTSEWEGKAVVNVWSYIFDESGAPVKGIIRDGSPVKSSLSRCFVDTAARAASWYAWIVDVHKTLTTTTKKARESKVVKAVVYINKAHEFLPLHKAIERGAKVFNLTVESVRQYYAGGIRKARQANKIALEIAAKKEGTK